MLPLRRLACQRENAQTIWVCLDVGDAMIDLMSRVHVP